MAHKHSITDPGHTHNVYHKRYNSSGSNFTLNWGSGSGTQTQVTIGYTDSKKTGITIDTYDGNTGTNGNSEDTESRPNNYTEIIWKRIN